jgi:hypothetical protein
MKFSKSVQIPAAVLVFLLAPRFAQGHSIGIVRLREARGPFVITVFTSSALVSGRTADVSLLVQRRDSTEALLDAIVSVVLTPPPGLILEHAEPMCGRPGLGTTMASQDAQTTIVARRDQSGNRLLYSASINFPLAGPWKLDTLVRHEADSAKFTCDIPVGVAARPLAGLLPCLALPLLLVALFAVNQWLRTPHRTKQSCLLASIPRSPLIS